MTDSNGCQISPQFLFGNYGQARSSRVFTAQPFKSIKDGGFKKFQEEKFVEGDLDIFCIQFPFYKKQQGLGKRDAKIYTQERA